MGLLDPETSDGRIIFFLPWQKHTLSGTTDSPCDVTYHPTPTEEEIEFILHEIKNYLNSDVEGLQWFYLTWLFKHLDSLCVIISLCSDHIGFDQKFQLLYKLY